MLEELNRKRGEELKQLEAPKSKITTLETEGQKMQDKIEHMQYVIDSLQNMMAWFRKKMFDSMSENNLSLDPSVLDEDKKRASEAIVYIGKLYGIEKEKHEAGLNHDAIQKRRQEESYKIIQEFEKWME